MFNENKNEVGYLQKLKYQSFLLFIKTEKSQHFRVQK